MSRVKSTNILKNKCRLALLTAVISKDGHSVL